MKIKFTKMHGAGNDYIYVNGFEEKIENPSELAIRWSHRHFGIGGDGLVLIVPSEKADCAMRMFNADGSEGRMCGNAVRCIGKYVYDHNIAKKNVITVETLSGIKTLAMTIENGVAVAARVDMGEPILQPASIPVLYAGETCIAQPFTVDAQIYALTCVSMGNPHAVLFTEQIDALDLEKIGPHFEHHAAFPERVNTEFVERVDSHTFKMRVWERGSGETLACGTGACAVTVAAILNGFAKKGEDIKIILRGGDLIIRWDEDGHVYMTGPAESVFEGEINL